MKKYLYASALAACLATPAFAADKKMLPESPDQPLQRRLIVLCIGVVVALQYLKHAPALPARRHYAPEQQD